MNCALFDKSTNSGTEVDQHIMNKFGCGAIGQRPLAAVAAIFQMLDKVCRWRFQ